MGSVPHETLRRKIGAARVSRPPLRNTDYVCDLFSRLLEERLKGALHGPVAITVRRCAVEKLTRALDADPPPVMLGVAETAGRTFGGAVSLTAPLLDRLIVAMIGAEGDTDQDGEKDEAVPARAPTAIDMAFAQPFVTDVIDCFEASMIGGSRPTARGALRFSRFARKSAELAAQPEATDMLSLHMTISIGEQERAFGFNLLIALDALDAYRALGKAEAARRPAGEDAAPTAAIWTAAMRAAARSAEYRLIGVLHEMKMSVEEIGKLTPGSVLPLPQGQRMEIDLRIDTPSGVAGAHGLVSGPLGASGEHRAVKIAAPPDAWLVAQLRPYAEAQDA